MATIGTNEVYVRLKDKSTSFHDVSQNKNVVSNRIVIMKRTAKVAVALHDQTLLECTEAEYNAYTSGVPTAPNTVPTTKKEPTVAAKKSNTNKSTQAVSEPVKSIAGKKASLITDDDDEGESEETT